MSPPCAAEPQLRWRTLGVLTLAMGLAVTTSWFAFGKVDSYSLEPAAMVRPNRLLVYTTQFVLIGAFVYWLTRTRFGRASFGGVAAGVTLAWLLEGLTLTVIGEQLVANELDPEIAWYYWLVATAGPIQPFVAATGGWLGLQHAHYPPQPPVT